MKITWHMGQCAVPENIHTPPTEAIRISWGVGGSVRPKNLKNCMKLNCKISRGGGGGVLEKNPFLGEGMDIFWNYTMLGLTMKWERGNPACAARKA